MEVRYSYRLFGPERRFRLKSYAPVSPPIMCCEAMDGWWDHIVTLGVQGLPYSSNICAFLIYQTDNVAGVGEIKSGVPLHFCPWCAEKIALVDAGLDTTPETPQAAQPPMVVLHDPAF